MKSECINCTDDTKNLFRMNYTQLSSKIEQDKETMNLILLLFCNLFFCFVSLFPFPPCLSIHNFFNVFLTIHLQELESLRPFLLQ